MHSQEDLGPTGDEYDMKATSKDGFLLIVPFSFHFSGQSGFVPPLRVSVDGWAARGCQRECACVCLTSDGSLRTLARRWKARVERRSKNVCFISRYKFSSLMLPGVACVALSRVVAVRCSR